MVICLERGADLHVAQLKPLPLTVSCFSKIQIGFTFLVYRLNRVVPDKGPLYVCVCVSLGGRLVVGGVLTDTAETDAGCRGVSHHWPGSTCAKRAGGLSVKTAPCVKITSTQNCPVNVKNGP